MNTLFPAGFVPLPTTGVIPNQCVGFYVQGAPMSYLQSTAGTQVALVGPRSVCLSNGQSLVKAGLEPLRIVAGSGEIVLQPNAVAVVNTKNGEPLSLVALSDAALGGVSATIDGQTYTVLPGEQLLVSTFKPGTLAEAPNVAVAPAAVVGKAVVVQKPAAANCKPVKIIQPVVVAPITGGCAKEVHHVYITKTAVTLPEYIPNLLFLQSCTSTVIRNWLYNRAAQLQNPQFPPIQAKAPEMPASKQPIASKPIELNISGEISESNADALPEKSKEKFNPVAYSVGVPGTPVAMPRTVVQTAPAGCLLSTGATLKVESPNVYRLDKGNALIFADRDLRINTRHAAVLAKAGSIVMITDHCDLTRVRDMFDRFGGDVKVIVGNKFIPLTPGREVSVTDTATDPIPLLYSDNVARRLISVNDVANYKVVTNDFSLVNLLAEHPLVKQWRCTQFDKFSFARILKTAAALNLVVDRYRGPYYAPAIARATTGSIMKQVDPIF